jgi:hypothetical protein
VREFISEFRGLSATAKQAAVLDKLGLARAPLESLCPEGDFDQAKIAALLAAMQEASKPVKPRLLGMIGMNHLARLMAAVDVEMMTFEYSHTFGVTEDGVPFVVEFAFGWRPESKRRLITGVNWSPAITNPFQRLGPYNNSLDGILSEQRVRYCDPVALVLHVACPRVEYTDRGKSAIVVAQADQASLQHAIIRAVTKGTDRWAKQRKAEERHESAIQNRRDRLREPAASASKTPPGR